MFLEELFGGCVTIISSLLVIQTAAISRENLQRDFDSRFEDNAEHDDINEGLIHREYEQEAQPRVPSNEEDVSVLAQDDGHPRHNFCESFLRSLKANISLLMAVVFVLAWLTVGVVYIDLNTYDVCVEWMYRHRTLPSNVYAPRMVGMCLRLLPLFAWFPTCIALLWGFKEFRKNYLLRLFVCAFAIGCITCVYEVIMADTYSTINLSYTQYRVPGNALFVLSIVCGAYLAAHKFKKVNSTRSDGVFRVFFILLFPFFGSCVLAYIYTYVIIKYFRETEGSLQKAVIAALTPGMAIPITAIAKYLVLRKCTKIITPGRAFVLCFFIRGGVIILYRTMQSGFQNIWLFIGLSLLHGVSNVLSKATLNLRIKIWKLFVNCYNKTCCGPRLQVQPLNSPRTRRFNADLEIQNILFEYTTVILSQAYLACYLVMNFDVSPWQVIKGSLTRTAISLAIDFVFNISSVFIQIHFYDIPMRKVWLEYWLRHLTANAFMIVVYLSYFSSVLVWVFAKNDYAFKENTLRNCTTVF